MADSSVIINTRMENRGIIKGVRDASREIAKISKAYDSTIASIRKQEIALSDLQRKYDALMEGQKTPASLSAMQTSLRNTEREIREVEKANKDLFAQYEAAAQKAEALRPFGETDEQFIAAAKEADRLAERLHPIWDEMDGLNAKAQDLRQSIAGVKMTPETSAEAQLLADKIKLATDNINKSHGEAASLEMDLKLATAEAERLKGALGESGGAESARASIDGIGQAAQTAAKVSTSAFKTIAGMIGGIAKGAGKAAKGVLGVAKNILTLGASSRKASGGVNGLFKRLLQLGAAAFVFNVLRKGLRELSDSIRNLLLANQEFASAWNQIKVNMISAFAPLWEVLEPAIVSFMQLLARFTAVLAQFMALLFGKTYTQARASAKALNDQSKALKGVGGAAKEASKQLASFDEINKLAAESGGGGGGGGADGLDFDFEEPPALAPWLEELANKLKGIFTEIDPEYWFNLGAALATWIADALNSIPWDKVQEWARVFAINLAGFLNGFLGSRELWESIGHTIAQGLNTALIFLYTLLTNLDFYNIASAIGHGINKFIEEFDWPLLARTIMAGLNGVLDTLLGLLDTVKWNNLSIKITNTLNQMFTDRGMWMKVGATLAKGINTAISFLSTAVKNFKWEEAGSALGAGINNFFNKVKWDEAGQLLSDLFKGVLSFINKAIAETDWTAFANDIATFLMNVDWGGIISKLFKLIGGIIAVSDLLLVTPLVALLRSVEAILYKEIKEVGGNIILGLFHGANKTIAGAFKWIHDNIFKPIIDAFESVFKIASPSKVMHELGVFVIQGFLNGIQSLIDNVIKLFQDAWSNIQKVWSVVSSWFNDNVVTPVKTAFDTALNNIAQYFTTAWSNASKAWSEAFKWFETNIIEPIKKAFDAALKAIYEFFSKVWTDIKTIWNVASGWFETNVTKPIRDAFDKAIKDITGFFNGLWKTVSDIFGKIGDLISNVLDKIGDVISGAGSASKAASSVRASSASSRSVDISPALFSPAIGNIEIPKLARGGIVDSATIALIGERGREAVMPLENHTEWIDTLANKLADRISANMEMALSGLGGGQSTVILEVDKRVFGQAVVELGDHERERMGVRIRPRAVLT